MLWPLALVAICALVTVFISRSSIAPTWRLAIASGTLVYFAVAALTTSSRRQPYVFFAVLALGIIVNELRLHLKRK